MGINNRNGLRTVCTPWARYTDEIAHVTTLKESRYDMNTLKRKNMMDAYTGFTGETTVKAIFKSIPEPLKQELSGRQLGILMNGLNRAFKAGKSEEAKEVKQTKFFINSVKVDGYKAEFYLTPYTGIICKFYLLGNHIHTVHNIRLNVGRIGGIDACSRLLNNETATKEVHELIVSARRSKHSPI